MHTRYKSEERSNGYGEKTIKDENGAKKNT
jgi:hypothetical protein